MKKAILLSKAEMKKVIGGNFPVDGEDDGGSGKCKGICILEGTSCPSPVYHGAGEICSSRYSKCCE